MNQESQKKQAHFQHNLTEYISKEQQMKKQIGKQKETRVQQTPKGPNSFLRPKETMNVTPVLSSLNNPSIQKTFLRQVVPPQVP